MEERVVGKEGRGSANRLSWLALNVGDQRRFAEADQIFARAEAGVNRSSSQDDNIRYLNHRALVERLRPDYPRPIALAEEAVRLSQGHKPDSTPISSSLLPLSLRRLP